MIGNFMALNCNVVAIFKYIKKKHEQITKLDQDSGFSDHTNFIKTLLLIFLEKYHCILQNLKF